MEGKRQAGSSSSSSFTSDLFGSKESSASSSSGIFESIFAPSSKVLGRESLRSEAAGKKPGSRSQVSSTKPGAPDSIPRGSGSEGLNLPNKDTSSFFQEERVQPCHLSSSIYYGGQEVYSNPQNSQSSSSVMMGEKKMIQAKRQEGTGGKDLSIIKSSLSMACELLILA